MSAGKAALFSLLQKLFAVFFVRNGQHHDCFRHYSVIRAVVSASQAVKRRFIAGQFFDPAFAKREGICFQIVFNVFNELEGCGDRETFEIALSGRAEYDLMVFWIHGASPAS